MQFLLLNETIEKECNVEEEDYVKSFAKHIEENEKTVLSLLAQYFINDQRVDDEYADIV